ncbi:hypothetical protein, partial [uncultured Porphyromonas sp.]|uniref:hypothetical protein n=1 Tax=uncultured Porphyromonas sp. TaxID=159274 RepID=UPI00260B8E60
SGACGLSTMLASTIAPWSLGGLNFKKNAELPKKGNSERISIQFKFYQTAIFSNIISLVYPDYS